MSLNAFDFGVITVTCLDSIGNIKKYSKREMFNCMSITIKAGGQKAYNNR